jgi:site-specific DNA recombinase
VWDHVTGLLADPQLIRTEIDRRLDSARTANPVAQQRKRLDTALAKTSNAIAGMIEAFSEQLITIDELRARMPDLRARGTNLRNQIEALNNQLADREAYLKLASDLEGFLTQLHIKAELSTVNERQRVLRLLVKDVLIGPDKITIRHRIPIRGRATDNAKPTTDADTEDDHAGHCPLRWGCDNHVLSRWDRLGLRTRAHSGSSGGVASVGVMAHDQPPDAAEHVVSELSPSVRPYPVSQRTSLLVGGRAGAGWPRVPPLAQRRCEQST